MMLIYTAWMQMLFLMDILSISLEAYKLRCTNGFTCDQTRCVDLSARCDGIFDCVDRTDELNCEPCRANELRCNDGTCIDRRSLCDNVKNCPNGEDENPEFCVSRKCPGKFLCRVTLSECVEKECSERALCPDYTDQAEEVCHSQPGSQVSSITCRGEEFRCTTLNQCVPSAYRCDGFRDCKDGSDEVDCPSGKLQPDVQLPGLTEFVCPDGLSIPLDWVCDGRADCPGGEDEHISSLSASNCGAKHKGVLNMTQKADGLCPKGTILCEAVSTLSEPKCIDQTKRCDGSYDCPDFTDELVGCEDLCEAKGQFTCRTHKSSSNQSPICIPRSAVCNGIIDCPNGDDEMEGPRTGCTTPSCSTNNGGCSQLCEVVGRQVKCSCNPGYFALPENPHVCVAIGDVSVLYLEDGQLFRRNLRESYSTAFRLWADVDGNKEAAQLVLNERTVGGEAEPTLSSDDPSWHPILQSFDYAIKPDSQRNNQLNLILGSTGSWSGVFASRTTSNTDATWTANAGTTRYWFDTLFLLPPAQLNGQKEILKRNLSIAYDWVHDLVYWADAHTGSLGVVRRKHVWKRTLVRLPQGRQPIRLVCDPRFGRLYYITRGGPYAIESVDADGKNTKQLITVNLSLPTALAIDYLQNELYWIDSGRGVVEAYHLRTKSRRSVLTLNTSQYRPTWVDVFEDWVYWSDSLTGSLMRANKRTGADMQTLFNITRPSAFRIQHELLRAPLVNRCFGNKCQQLCLPIPLRSYPNYSVPYQCACDDQWSHSPDSPHICRAPSNDSRTNRQGKAPTSWKMRAEAYHSQGLMAKGKTVSIKDKPEAEHRRSSPFILLIVAMTGSCLFGMSISCLGHYTYRAHVQRRSRKSEAVRPTGNGELSEPTVNNLNNTEEQLQLIQNQLPSEEQVEPIVLQNGHHKPDDRNSRLQNLGDTLV